MLVTVYVAVGGALGSALRYGLNRWLAQLLGDALPWGTIVINILGSYVIGLATAFFGGTAGALTPIEMRQFVLVGVCGGFTTFSSFSLQTLTLFEAGEPGQALLNIALSLTLCLIAVALGFMTPGALTSLSRSVGA